MILLIFLFSIIHQFFFYRAYSLLFINFSPMELIFHHLSILFLWSLFSIIYQFFIYGAYSLSIIHSSLAELIFYYLSIILPQSLFFIIHQFLFCRVYFVSSIYFLLAKLSLLISFLSNLKNFSTISNIHEKHILVWLFRRHVIILVYNIETVYLTIAPCQSFN